MWLNRKPLIYIQLFQEQSLDGVKVCNQPRVNASERKKNSYTIEIVLGKNGYVETMGAWQYFYHRVSKAGGSNHSLCFLQNVTNRWFIE